MRNCLICGKPIDGDPRKRYCDICARQRALSSKAEYAKRFRRERKAENAENRVKVKEQAEEIEALKRVVSRQRRRIRELCAMIRELNQKLNWE